MQQGRVFETSSRILRDSTKLVTAHFTVSLFSFCYFALLTRTFSKFDISVLAVTGIINAIGGSISGLGLMTFALQRVPGLKAGGSLEEATGMLKSCIICSLAGAAVVSSALMAASTPLSLLFFKTQSGSSLIVALGMLLFSYKMYESVNLSMQAMDDFRMVAIARLLNDICLRIIAFPVYFFGGILGYLFALAIGQLALSAVLIGIKRKQFTGGRLFNWPLVRRMVRDSLPFYGLSIVRVGSMQVDSLLVGILLNPDVLAVYYVARRFYDYLVSFIDATLMPLIPKIAERREHDGAVANAFNRSSRYFLVICIVILAILLPFSGQLLAFLGGAKYMAGLTSIRWFLVAAVLYGLYSLHSSFILAVSWPRDSLINELVVSITSLLLSAWLVVSYGVVGGAIAKTVTAAIAIVTSFWILNRSLSIKLSYDWALMRRILPVSIAGACFILLSQVWVQSVAVSLLVCAVILFVLFRRIIRSGAEDADFLINSFQIQGWPIAKYILRFIRY